MIPSARTARLNPKFTFQSFVCRSKNSLAFDAARTGAEMPGSAHNPFFLYGRPRVGKTHLLHAIGNQLIGRDREVQVALRNTEQLTQEYIEAIRDNRLAAFRNT
jgi:chromosomal replication initiator protein